MRGGFFAVGIAAGKTPANAGSLMRSAHAFGASYVFTAGARYPVDRTDTTRAWRHLPAYEWANEADVIAHMPKGAKLIGVECGEPYATRPLASFVHPEAAVYVLGSEDRGLSPELAAACDHLVEIPSALCLNVAVAGSILMYDRTAKR